MTHSHWLVVGLCVYAAILGTVGYACRLSHASADQLILGGRKLNRYLVAIAGMSAANSGFIMTGAVGAGYVYGLNALLLPISWFLGDVLFWLSQAANLNSLARRTESRSIPALLTCGDSPAAKRLRTVLGILIVGVALLYSCSQFVAAGKILASFTHLSVLHGVVLTFVVVTFVCVTGGFRGTLWTDILQGLMMVVTTVVVLSAAIFAWRRAANAGVPLPQIGPVSSMIGGMSLPGAGAFIAGWAAAGFGFSLSQPHVVLLYMAGRSPKETSHARWMYIFLVQLTWVGMTFFGVLIRGLVTDVADPEGMLAVFTLQFCGPFVAIVILSGAFSAVGSTIDGLVISSVGTLMDDVFQMKDQSSAFRLSAFCFVTVSAALVWILPLSVFNIAVLAVSLLACTVGPLVMLRLALPSLSSSVATSLLLANVMIFVLWRVVGASKVVSEVLPAFVLAVGVLCVRKRR